MSIDYLKMARKSLDELGSKPRRKRLRILLNPPEEEEEGIEQNVPVAAQLLLPE